MLKFKNVYYCLYIFLYLLMIKFKKFYFEKFEFDKKTFIASFFYSFDQKEFFEEKIDFSSNFFKLREKINYKIVENILFHIHIALWISYYKLYPTSDLIIKSGFLEKDDIDFWKKFYRNWLWEFLYKNKISSKKLFNFKNLEGEKYTKIDFSLKNKSLVPIWWWKDSIVTIELLKDIWFDFDLFVFWKNDFLKENTQKISWKHTILVKRKISENLFNFNKKGYYNWHVPITWIIAFNMLLVSYLYNYKYLILSNELSANYGNTLWDWFSINHQYSKSLDFEKDFMIYIDRNISSDIKYFSLLRWLYEFKIAQLFSKKAEKYFKHFSSCNRNFTIKKDPLVKDNLKEKKYWCNNCPKCAFVYSILSWFLEKEKLIGIFWEDLYEKKSLESIFRELLWITWIKPFECVWEKQEVILWMYKSINKFKNKWYILDIFKNEVLVKFDDNYFDDLEKKLLKIYDDDIIPENFKNKIKFQ